MGEILGWFGIVFVWVGFALLGWILSNFGKICRVLFNTLCRVLVAPFVTPRAHTAYGDYRKSEAYRSLSNEGYGIDPKFASNAVAAIETK